MDILALSGSLREGSYNTGLLRAATFLLPPGVELRRWHDLKAIPPFDEDDESHPPLVVQRLRVAVQRADAVLIATPEYNGSVPGQLKNALDWLSRPMATNPLRDKPLAVIGASAGMFGGVWAQEETRKVLRLIGGRVLDDDLPVGRAAEAFDEHGRLRDAGLERRLGAICDWLVLEAAAGRQAA